MWDKLFEKIERQRDDKSSDGDSIQYLSQDNCDLMLEIMEEIEKEKEDYGVNMTKSKKYGTGIVIPATTDDAGVEIPSTHDVAGIDVPQTTEVYGAGVVIPATTDEAGIEIPSTHEVAGVVMPQTTEVYGAGKHTKRGWVQDQMNRSQEDWEKRYERKYGSGFAGDFESDTNQGGVEGNEIVEYGADPEDFEYEMSYPEDSANMPLGNEDTWHPDIEDFPYMGEGNVQGGGGRVQGAEIPVPPNANLYGVGFDGDFESDTNQGGVEGDEIVEYGGTHTTRGWNQDRSQRSSEDWERMYPRKDRKKSKAQRDKYGADIEDFEYEMSYPEDSANMPLGNEDTWHPDIEDFPYMGEGNVMGGGGRVQGAEIPVPPNANLYYGAVEAANKYTPYVALGLIGFIGYMIYKRKAESV